MARRLQAFDFSTRRGNPKYPWDQWTDGQAWQVVHGKDYTCTSGSLVVYLYHKANVLGMKVNTSILRSKGRKPERVVFQFVKGDVASVATPANGPKRLKKRKANDDSKQDSRRHLRVARQAEA